MLEFAVVEILKVGVQVVQYKYRQCRKREGQTSLYLCVLFWSNELVKECKPVTQIENVSFMGQYHQAKNS